MSFNPLKTHVMQTSSDKKLTKLFNNSFFCVQIINKYIIYCHETDHERLDSFKINTCNWKTFVWRKISPEKQVLPFFSLHDDQ